MQAKTFFRAVTMDKANLMERLIELLAEHDIRYAVIDGQGVNAYSDPVVSLDLDIAVATEQVASLEKLLGEVFTVRRFPNSINVSSPDSNVRVQIQTDPRYSQFAERAKMHEVLGYALMVAAAEDVLQGKIWAALDPTRRGSKRQKDLADISRMIETQPRLRSMVPDEILRQLL